MVADVPATVEAALDQRDHHDSTRELSPLTQADDAVMIDSTTLTLDEVIDQITAIHPDKGCHTEDRRFGAKTVDVAVTVIVRIHCQCLCRF